jgi:hypothetical protein
VVIQDEIGTAETLQHITNAFDLDGDDLRW